MSKHTHALGLFVGLSAMCFALPASAALITFHFEGTVDIAQGELLDELLSPGLTASDLLGTPFHGSYTFDSTVPDGNASPQVGSYLNSGPPARMEFHFVHRSFIFDEFVIGVINDLDIASVTPGILDDSYAAQSTPNPHPTDPLLGIRGRLDLLAFGDAMNGPSIITTDILPLVPPDPTAFDVSRAFINVVREEIEDGETVSRVRAGLGTENLRILRVPEPAGWLLLSAGLAALRWHRRRGRRA